MARKNAPTRNMKPFYIALALIAVVGVGAIVYSMRGGEMSTEPLDLSQIEDAATLIDRAQGISIGDADAPVQIIVFSDYQCPGCAYWAGQIEPLLKPEFIETGKVRYTYYDFPLISIHKHAFLAARAGRCANDQGKFWEFHNRAFAGQNEWAFSQSAPVSQFTQYARDVGLNESQFTQCLRSDAHAEVVTANQVLGETLGVGGTPTVYVNQRRLGDREWQDYAAVSAAIQAAGGV